MSSLREQMPTKRFWDSLPYRNGKYRATQTHCYYKENFHANKTRLEVFRRSGKRPHAGDCCMECGTQQTGPRTTAILKIALFDYIRIIDGGNIILLP